MRRLPIALALGALAFGATLSATTIIDLAGYPSPVRLQAEGGTAQDQAGGAVALADLDGDGIDDLVIGARYADPRGRVNAGQVFVVYGGPNVQGTVFLSDTYAGPTVRGAAPLDQLGEALAAGDFDGNGRDDLAVGASWVDAAGRADAGAVYLFLGAGSGFPSIDLASQAAPVTVLGAAASQRCGSAVVLADLDGDGRDELIIGCPRAGQAGRVHVVAGTAAPGSTIDLAASGASSAIDGSLSGGEFGAALAAGDVNHDGKEDLLAGAPYASPAGRNIAGAAYLILGRSPFGSVAAIGQAAEVTILGAAAGDTLGSAVAAGDLSGDSRFELLLGAPGSSPGGATGAGAAYTLMLPGSFPAQIDLAAAPAALTLAGSASYDKLGTSVAAADLDRDGRADMLAGAPNGDPPGRPQAGLLLAVSGVRAAGRHATDPDLILYGAGSSDRAASSLALGDFTADGALDLVVGAPRSDSVLGLDAGSVYVAPGPFRLLPPPPPTPTVTPHQYYLPLLIKQGAGLAATSLWETHPARTGGNHDAP